MALDPTPPNLVTMTSVAPARSEEAADGYLLCIVEGASWTLPLPAGGELVIGRDAECELRLTDALVSRRHAQLTVQPEGVRLVDLDSRHGTLVNGERVTRPRLLLTGDVITLGTSVLIVHRSVRASSSRALLEGPELVARLETELERCLRYERAMTVAVVRTAERIDRARLASSLGNRLRLIDAAAVLSDHELALLLPELDEDEAEVAVAALRDAIGSGARAGVSISPHDGCDADTLLVGARGAAEGATAGELAWVRRDVETHAIGGLAVAVADPAMRRLHELIRRLARSDLPILVQGETGAGKEIVARAIHHHSPRADKSLISVNCAALPETLAESELFGHERGAFTGAVAAKPGLLERATGGTVFLDEIGELPLAIQAKLLRVLEVQRVTRLGAVDERAIDVRLVAATNRDLGAEVTAGRFRQDLLFRINAARVVVPPLRDRRRELTLLAEHLLGAACTRAKRRPLDLSLAVLQALHLHAWPGNVRELKNAMDFAAAGAPEDAVEVELWHLPDDVARAAREAQGSGRSVPGLPAPTRTAPTGGTFRPIGDEVRELERARMVEALVACEGQQTKAAELIAMPLRTFVTKLKRYRIVTADWKPADRG